MILEDLLQHEGASVEFVENGKQAVDKFTQFGRQQVDIILMDIQMPVMDGFTAARKILQQAADVPIIGVTAHALHEERDKCLDAGMLDHVTKPIDPDELVLAIRRCLQMNDEKAG